MTPSFKTPTRNLGPSEPCYVIAEAGVHHYGSLDKAYSLIDAAKKAGADAIKFQTYKAETLVTQWAPRYWQPDPKDKPGTQFDTFKERDTFNLAEYKAMATHCNEVGIDFLSTPFDERSVDWLEECGVPFYKIASADHTHFPLLAKCAATGKPLVLSVGAATVEEIRATVAFLRAHKVANIGLLHCVLSYPTPDAQAALRKIETLRQEFPDCLIGYSDHTIPERGLHVQMAAVALGAKILEKHFTLDRSLPLDDHYHAFDPKLLLEFMSQKALLEPCLGNGKLEVQPCEEPARKNARRSLVAAKDIKKGETLTHTNLTAKRPGTGVSPVLYEAFLGKKTRRNIKLDELILEKDLG